MKTKRITSIVITGALMMFLTACDHQAIDLSSLEDMTTATQIEVGNEPVETETEDVLQQGKEKCADGTI